MSKTFKIDENEPVTEERVRDWLHKASIRELNIFYDRNKIIIILCKALLKYMNNKEKK